MEKCMVLIICIMASGLPGLLAFDQSSSSSSSSSTSPAASLSQVVNPELNKKLFDAVYQNNPQKIKMLFSRTEIPEIEAYNSNFDTPLQLAARKNYTEVIKELLAHGAKIMNALSGEPKDEKSQGQLLRAFIKANGNVNEQQSNGPQWTPLMYQVVLGNPNNVELLLRQPGIDTTLRSSDREGNKTFEEFAKINWWDSLKQQEGKAKIPQVIRAYETKLLDQKAALQSSSSDSTTSIGQKRKRSEDLFEPSKALTPPGSSSVEPTIPEEVPAIQALFGPEGHDIKEILIKLIDTAKNHIAVAVYTFTASEIADALIRARQRGVTIIIVADRKQTTEEPLPIQSNLLKKLSHNKIPVYLWPTNKMHKGIMHNKFIIFESAQPNEQPLLWTGSYNFTERASDDNEENALLIRDKEIIRQYRARINHLKKGSVLLNQ